jgi:hypothetical protein
MLRSHGLVSRAFEISLVLGALGAFTACGSQSTGTSSTSSQVVAADGSLTAGDPAAFSACLTTYVGCLRADAADAASCRSDLHACLPKPPGRPHGDGDGDGGCDHEGKGPPPPERDGGVGAPPPPPEADGGLGVPPPPPPDGDGGLGAPPPHEGGHEGPRACMSALDACAAGSATADACVTEALACIAALPKPPPHPGH